MPDMFATKDTSQEEMSWLKAALLANMPDMSVTEETSQSRGWLNSVTLANMPDMSVTEDTSQEEMSWLKVAE